MTWLNDRLPKMEWRTFWEASRLVVFSCLVAFATPLQAAEGGIKRLYSDAKVFNITLISRIYDREISENAIDEARSLLLPQISISHSEAYKNPKYDFGNYKKAHLNDYSLDVMQPLYNQQSWSTLKQSKIALQLSGLQEKQSDTALLKSLVTFYLEYLKQQELLIIADQRLTSNEMQLRQSEEMFKGGMIVVTAVHEARSSLDLARASRLNTEHTLQASEQQLYDFLRSRDVPIDEYILGLNVDDPRTLPFEVLLNVDIQQNIDLLIANKQLKLLQAALRTARAEHYPTLDLTASQTDSSAPESKPDRTFTLTLSLPLYQGGRPSARVAQSRLKVDQQQEVLTYTGFRIRDQIANIVENYQILSDQYQASLNARESSNKALQALQAGFRGGERTITDVLSAQNSTFDIDQSLTLIKFELLRSYMELNDLAGQFTPELAKTLVK